MAVTVLHWACWGGGHRQGGHVAWSGGNGERLGPEGVLCPRTPHAGLAGGDQLGSGDTFRDLWYLRCLAEAAVEGR